MSRKTSFTHWEKEMIEEFLEGKPTSEETKRKRKFERVWWGESSFKTKDEVKRLARGGGEKSAVAFNPDQKLWGTHDLAAVADLIHSTLWEPDCIPSDLFQEIERLARERAKKDDPTTANKRKRDDDEEQEAVAYEPHTSTLARAASKDRVPFGSWPTMRECPECHVVPLLQFLECGCLTEAMDWKVCRACDVSWHPTKLPKCLCN
jgi:hypothetical protein